MFSGGIKRDQWDEMGQIQKIRMFGKLSRIVFLKRKSTTLM